MIKKIEKQEHPYTNMARFDKINELVDAYNEFADKFVEDADGNLEFKWKHEKHES